MSSEIAVYFDPSVGKLRRFAATDVLLIDSLDRLAGSGNMSIGGSLGATEELQLGSATSDVRVLGDLLVDGSSTISVDETVTGSFSVEGDAALGNNSGDTVDLGGGTSDTVNLNTDLTVGDNAVGIGSSTTDALDELWLSSVVGGAGSGINLNATGDGTSGSEAIGVYTGGFLNISPGTSDLQTVLESIDSAIGSGGATLQTAYSSGNTIAVTTANGPVSLSNSADTTDVLDVTRTFAGAGIGIDLQMGPGNEAVTGIGLSITSGTGATGAMLFVNNLGSGNALQVQDGGTDVLVVTSTGAISATAQQASTFSTAAGNLSFDAIAGELSFDDVGNSGLTLSQSSDRTLAQTGTGEVLDGVTSIVGALNALAEYVDVEGGPLVAELPIANGVTVTAGYCVGQDTAGRVTNCAATSDANSKFVGIALSTGTGDVGGTVVSRVALPGSKVTVSGAAFTGGNALFLPGSAGIPTETAPSTAGDAVKRVGWAHDSTSFVIETGPTVII
jgi:hypothetical protein